jgi:hypothetical protein
MGASLDQGKFQSQDSGDFSELVDRGIAPTILQIGQATQRDPGQLRQITLTQPEKFASGPKPLSDFLSRHRITSASECAFEDHSARERLAFIEMRIKMRF